MSILEKLLAPYAAATSGQATGLDYLKQDPVYGTLFPTVTAEPNRNRRGAGPATATGLISLAKQLEGMGFDVGELEGFQGEGQINSGHATNSQHFSGDAADVNYRGGGRWDSEGQALNWLAKYLKKRYTPSELFWPGNDPVGGHDSHLHAGFR